jgi:hypothetical protein
VGSYLYQATMIHLTMIAIGRLLTDRRIAEVEAERRVA